MAKITKKQLKAVVKECLVEILSEGLEGSVAGLSKKRQRAQHQDEEEQKLVEGRKRFEHTVESAVSNVTDDPIMRGILQDTARTTLQEQISNDSPGSPGAAQLSAGGAAGIDLGNIFGEPAQNWSKLAFKE